MFPARTGFEQEYPFASHELKFDGLRYHYVDEGSGPTLLFVHGNPTWSFAFRNLIKALSPSYRVLAVDHIGCGFSDKPQNYPYRLAQHVANLERFVTELDLRDITLFAHDWGGAIGMGVATRLPERFSRFVLFNTAAFRSQRIPLRIAVCRIPGLGAIGVRGLNLFSRAALRMAVAHPERLTPAVRAGYLAPYDSWAHRIAIDRFVRDIPMHPQHPSYATLLEIEDGLQNRRLLARNRQVGNQATVYLDHVNGQADEVVHGGQAGAEVVQTDVYFQIGHTLEDRKRPLGVLIYRGLGHFKA